MATHSNSTPWLPFDSAPEGTPKMVSPSYDPTARKHKGNRRSKAAHEIVAPHQASIEERIRAEVVNAGWHGMTLKEACALFGKTPNQISGRFSTLRHVKQEIFDSGRERENCTVYVGHPHWINRSESNETNQND